jgi:hypothetical protein
MIGDYVVETKHGEIRLIPHSMLGYAEIGDHILGTLIEDNKIRSENPWMPSVPLFMLDKLEYVDFYTDIPLTHVIEMNEYFYEWNSKRGIRHKLAEIILNRKILVTRKR